MRNAGSRTKVTVEQVGTLGETQANELASCQSSVLASYVSGGSRDSVNLRVMSDRGGNTDLCGRVS